MQWEVLVYIVHKNNNNSTKGGIGLQETTFIGVCVKQIEDIIMLTTFVSLGSLSFFET